jgi:hypothetical protein
METYKVIFKAGETQGVYGISLVESPAMESQFIALATQEPLHLKAIDSEKRILLGAVLIPDKPIYRNQGGKEFNIIFPAETIRLTSENYHRQGYQNNSTLEHDEQMKLSDVTFVESWIKEDMINDKSAMHGFNEPIGTWFASMKVDSDEVWNDFVKTGKVKGFSIDGLFDLEKINLKSNNSDLDFRNKMVAHHEMAIDMVNEYEGLLKDKTLLKIASDIIETQTVEINTMQKLNLKTESNMNVTEIVEAIKSGFASLSLKKDEEIKLGSIMTQDQSLKVEFEGDTIAVNTQVFLTAEDGTKMDVPDGEYMLEDGMTIVVEASLVKEIKEPTQETAPDVDNAPAEMQSAPATTPSVKSEKHTQEVFYQLAQVMGKQMEAKFAELETKLSLALENKQETVSLTKQKEVQEIAPRNAKERIQARLNQAKK